MRAVVRLNLVLLGLAHSVETYCDGRQHGAQCYGALGGSVELRLMNNALKIVRFQWISNTSVVLNGYANKVVSNLKENRSFFIRDNGTFIFHDLSRTDSGEYNLIIYDSEGRKSEGRSLHLTIQAPVSSVRLVSECLSQGERKVSCSSEGGDSPQYNWTLNGHTLTDAELLENNIIILQQGVSGRLVCSASNHISNVSKEENISDCGFIFINCTLTNGTHISQWVFAATKTLCIEPTTAPTTITDTAVDNSLLICGLRAVVAVFLLIGITVFFAWKKKKSKKAEGSAIPQTMDYENSVVMVEMRHSGPEL